MKNINVPARLSLCTVLLALGAGCKSPFDRTKDQSGGGALGIFGTGNLVVFSNELQTGGGAFIYPGSENQSLIFNDTSNPVSARSIRYTWNGQDVSSNFGPEHTFAGFDLMHTTTLAAYSTTPGKDLRAAGYTHVTFYARGSLSSDTLVKVEVSDDGAAPAPCLSLSDDGLVDDAGSPCGILGDLSTEWRPFSIPIAGTDLANVKDFFKATMIFNQGVGTDPGNGGTIYFDQIQFVP